jgi:hypothetical protein
MAAIFQGECLACGFKTIEGSDVYCARIVDSPSDSPCSHPDDRRLVIVFHPLGDSINKLSGLTHPTILDGRLVYVRRVICRECGVVYESRRVSGTNAIGCVGTFCQFAFAGLAAAIIGWKTKSLILALIVGFLALMATIGITEGLVKQYVRWRWKDRVRQFDYVKPCPHCGSKRYSSFRSSSRKFPCPQCGQVTVRIRLVGIS